MLSELLHLVFVKLSDRRTLRSAPQNDSQTSETTPLLASPSIESAPNHSDDESVNPIPPPKDEDVPLPKVQILVLCLGRMVEPVAFFGIFPFINKMIWETGGIDEEDVGFYSGLIESMFSLTQVCVMVAYGITSDRLGRKPVLVFSLSGVAVAIAIFGFSKSIWQMILFRCCAGLFAGSVVTIRTMISEVSTAKTQARAFSFFAVSGNIGIFLGPLIGGAFANPTDQYPSVFGKIQFLKQYPYSLPTLITGLIGAIAAVCCALFLKETLKRKGKDGTSAEAPMTTWEVMKSPGVPIVLYISCHVMLLGFAYTAVAPLFYFTHAHLGGYGFTPPQISLFFAAIGVSQGLYLLIIFPPLQRRYGTHAVLRGCLTAWPFLFIFGPICNMFLKKGWTVAFWIVAPLTQIGGSGVAMAFTCVQLLLNAVSPSPSSLGTLNAIMLTLLAGIRTVGPALFTSLFAFGARTQVLGGYLVWFVLIVLAVLGRVLVMWCPGDDGVVPGTKKAAENSGGNRGEGEGEVENVNRDEQANANGAYGGNGTARQKKRQDGRVEGSG